MITPEGYKDMLKALGRPKKRKYRNVITYVDGLRFDSKREAARYGELKLLEQAGKISSFRRQVVYALLVNGWPVCNYIADFVYRDEKGLLTVEDVKSKITRKDPVYVIKKKLMSAIHGIAIKEVL